MKSQGDAAAAAPTAPEEAGVAAAKAEGASPAAGEIPAAEAPQETQKASTKASDKEVEKAATKPKKAATKRKTTPRRAAASPTRGKRASASPAAGSDGEATESEPEKQQPKKRAKVGRPPASSAKKALVRRKKATPRKTAAKQVELDSDSEDEEQKQVETSVAALSDDIKAKFGEIVWAKMGGYPYWPCLIMDPRLLPPNLQQTALKTLDSKYIVFFYKAKNYASVAFKWIEPWSDTKFNYREGHPAKAAVAPKRRATLMAAIELADKEVTLPIQERADGLLKPEEKEPKPKPKPAPETPAPVKRKIGRPLGSKNKTTAAKKTPKKKQAKEETEEAAKETVAKEEAKTEAADTAEEEEAAPTRSKEEIKAKLASRKTPSRKKQADDIAQAAAAAKKTAKATSKQSGKAHGASTGDVDSKRKKEIELVVPHKSVKSEDIREMTEEAAKKKLGGGKGGKIKKDKGDYRVGDLGVFAKKLTRLHATASTRNNDELVKMLRELFEEKVMFRSDVERSGLAAIIAALRKSSSPTVGQTASALRKHMMKILNNDTAIADGSKKQKAGAAAAADKPAKKRKVDSTVVKTGEPTMVKDTAASSAEAVKTEASDSKKDGVKVVEDAQQSATAEPPAVAEAKKTEVSDVKAMETEPVKDAEKETSDAKERTETLSKTQTEDDVFKGEKDLDKNRAVFVDMLSHILRPDGAAYAKLAKEIEGLVFDRYSKDSNGDYQTQARVIIFGLKKNAELRKRLFSGSLHCLELAYAGDDFFRPAE